MKKQYRIKKSDEFKIIMKNKIFFAHPTLVLYMKERAESNSRIGISVKNKVGNAVIRNKVKRQLRMMVQELFDFNDNYDYILLVKEKFIENDYNFNKKTLETLYNKSKKVRISR